MFIEEIPYTLFEKVDKPLTAPYFWIINTDFIVGKTLIVKKSLLQLGIVLRSQFFSFKLAKLLKYFIFTYNLSQIVMQN